MFQVREFDIHPNCGDKHYDVKICKDCGSDADTVFFGRDLCSDCARDYIEEFF